MNFNLNDEQLALRDLVEKTLKNKCPVEEVRRLMETDIGYSEEHWATMAEQGWTGLVVPEEYDGLGLGITDLGVIMEEMGVSLCPSPFFATVVLGAQAILKGGNEEQKKAYLPKVSTGEIKLTLAIHEDDTACGDFYIKGTARKNGGNYVLNGTKLFVPYAHAADALICAMRTKGNPGDEDGISLFIVDSGAKGVQRNILRTMDMTSRQCEVVLDNVVVPESALLGQLDQGGKILRAVIDYATVVMCAEMLGGMRKSFNLALEYAKIREQFGVPIGSFQIIKHYLADMVLMNENAQSITYSAACSMNDDAAAEDKSLACSMAKAYCGDAYTFIVNKAVQIFGGIGFSWEHDIHLYLKKAKNLSLTFGDSDYHRDRVANLIGLDG